MPILFQTPKEDGLSGLLVILTFNLFRPNKKTSWQRDKLLSPEYKSFYRHCLLTENVN